MAIKKRQNQPAEPGKSVDLAKSLFAKNFPSLFEFLSATSYEDGTARQTATVTVFVTPSGFQAALNDRDQAQGTFVTSATVDGLWASLEKGLAEDTLQWRPSRGQYQKKGKK